MRHARWLGCAAALALTGCASPPTAPPAEPPPRAPAVHATAAAPAVAPRSRALARSERLLLVQPAADDTAASLAASWLGDETRAWEISELNRGAAPGEPLALPLEPLNPGGVTAGSVQTVPVLCYHRFGPRAGRMTVTPAAFAQQMAWLADNGYRVVRLSDLEGFLQGRRSLPPRSVVLTIDDGYESVFRHAWPVLQRHGFPVTLFLVTDFIGSADALGWPQLREMVDSGLVEIGAHTRTHRNLALRPAGESDSAYRRTLDAELRQPREQLGRSLGVQVRHLAYPYGDANAMVLEAVAQHAYELGATVSAGGNAFYAQPLLLRRSMVYGDQDLAAFQSRLQTQRVLSIP